VPDDDPHRAPSDLLAQEVAARGAAEMWAGDRASQALGIEVTEVVPGRARARMTIAPSMVNGHSIAHGGYVFLLADTAFAFACNTYGEITVARSADITFLAPAREGDRLVADAVQRHRAGRNGIYDVTVRRDGSGEVVAEFRGHSRELGRPSHDRGELVIRAAGRPDLPRLVDIERAAGELFRTVGMDLVADADPGSVEELATYADDGRALVAVDVGDQPVAYLVLDVVDGCGHIEQVSVHPHHARRGIGRSLADRAAVWADGLGLPALTLTTYVAVPWNGPYYERLGFRYLRPEEETPGLRSIRAHERALGLDAWPRACMSRRLPPAS
jgi:phenylacetic acid degradation protein PaaD